MGAGSTATHCCVACGRRGWNRQPDGKRAGLGGSPSSSDDSVTRRPPIVGAAASSDCVYGCRGSVNTCSVSPISTTRPRYITAIRWLNIRTTERSWLMSGLDGHTEIGLVDRFWIVAPALEMPEVALRLEADGRVEAAQSIAAGTRFVTGQPNRSPVTVLLVALYHLRVDNTQFGENGGKYGVGLVQRELDRLIVKRLRAADTARATRYDRHFLHEVRSYRCRGSRTVLSRSPTRLTAITVANKARPGKIMVHGA